MHSLSLYKSERSRMGFNPINNSASPEIIWELGGPEEDHQLYHCCWNGRVSEREEEENPNWCNLSVRMLQVSVLIGVVIVV